MEQKTTHHVFHWLLLGVFFFAIFAPATQMILGDSNTYSFTEKRLLASFPKTPKTLSQTPEFTSSLDSYFDDHFGFREWFVFRYQRESRKHFNTIEKAQVIVGLNDWYYFTGSNILQDYSGKDPLSDEELSSWVKSYRDKKKWLKSKDIHYLFVAPPNKHTIYPEFVMEDWYRVQGKTRLQQLREVLTKNDKDTFIDLAPVLTAKKDDDILFYKSDTHWTDYGAYLGYQTLVQKLETIFPKSSFKKDFTFTNAVTRTCDKKVRSCGDLTRMLLDFKPFEESFQKTTDFSPCATRLPFNFQLHGDINTIKDAPSFTKGCKSKKLKAVVFRDSFFVSMQPFLSENFAEVIYLWQKYDQENMKEILKYFQPDIVIEERVERSLF